MIYICDFDDSFTYNIYSELMRIDSNLKTKVILKKNLIDFFNNILLADDDESIAIILGPGPGNPVEYQDFCEPIKKLLIKTNVFLMGICLGHQLIWKVLGARITPCRTPLHGQSISYKLSEKLSKSLGTTRKILVQNYNSLAVGTSLESDRNILELKILSLSRHNEIIIASGDRLLTYQFHPESVGTTSPESFFQPLIEFFHQNQQNLP